MFDLEAAVWSWCINQLMEGDSSSVITKTEVRINFFFDKVGIFKIKCGVIKNHKAMLSYVIVS